MANKQPKALIILDGFGMRDEVYGNAVKQAQTPNFDYYFQTYPHTYLQAYGEAVGLPDGQMGNSEVGHLNIGAGRIVYQSLTRVNLSIESGEFFSNQVFLQSMSRAKENNKALHLFGLLSDGGVHSHINHLFALLKLAKQMNLTKVYVHAFLDGRDVGPRTAKTYIQQTEEMMASLGIGEFATISGRYYAMDRDLRWDRVKKAYDAIAHGQGPKYETSYEAIEDSYQQGVYDEFVMPSVIVCKDNQPVGQVNDGDSIIFYNFRPDRAIQISEAFANETFHHFDRGTNMPKDLHFVTLTDYSESINCDVAYEPNALNNTIGEVLATNGLSQLRIAETEKYPHVTYFISGGLEQAFPGEKRILIDSPAVATYDLKPEMSAYEVTDALLRELELGELDVIILNFANPDMVGHSGKLAPTIKAVEAVDDCLGRVVRKILSLGGEVIITADHGKDRK